jgi:hypothetical protein
MVNEALDEQAEERFSWYAASEIYLYLPESSPQAI